MVWIIDNVCKYGSVWVLLKFASAALNVGSDFDIPQVVEPPTALRVVWMYNESDS